MEEYHHHQPEHPGDSHHKKGVSDLYPDPPNNCPHYCSNWCKICRSAQS